ncbi:MAG: hypothetical protein ACRD3B_01295 [Candidatus Sulfotelmatobacter sp.]
MNDEPIEGNEKQETEYDTRDAEVPIVLHHVPASLEHHRPKYEESHTQHYVVIALKGIQSALLYIWRTILWNKAFWHFASTVTMAVAAAIYTHYAAKQWRVANETLIEIKSGKADTQKIVTSAETQAAAATKNASAADKFSTSAANIDTNIGQAEEDFQRMADASEKSLRAVSQTDQRAWVGITDDGIQGINPIKDMNDMSGSMQKYGYVRIPYTFKIKNVGKTPARYIVVGSMYSAGTEPIVPDLQTEPRHGTMFPNAGGTVYGHEPIMLNREQFQAWKFQGNYVFIYIYIQYSDIFPDTKPHHTWSCTKINSLGTQTFCHTWNDAD